MKVGGIGAFALVIGSTLMISGCAGELSTGDSGRQVVPDSLNYTILPQGTIGNPGPFSGPPEITGGTITGNSGTVTIDLNGGSEGTLTAVTVTPDALTFTLTISAAGSNTAAQGTLAAQPGVPYTYSGLLQDVNGVSGTVSVNGLTLSQQ